MSRLPEPLRRLPYAVHTNRELGLMLKGVKPLAYFALDFADAAAPDMLVRYFRMFDRHAAAGRFIRREVVEPLTRERRLRRLLYALPGQEGRIAAMLALVGFRGPWTEARERRFGELLGYEDWQNDLWLAGPGRRRWQNTKA